MSDEEYIKNISSVSTEELFNSLEYYGYDSYYTVLWRATIEELKKRSEERPHGEWKGNNFDEHYCSLCGHSALYEEEPDDYYEAQSDFCPNCEADMRGEK